jgi:hypothetical protein
LDPGGISQIFFLRVFGLKIIKFFDADPDPDPGYGILSTLDSGYETEKLGSGILDPE